MPQFTGGPAVRVSPNVSIQFKWITDVSWFGKVDIFDNPDATGAPLVSAQATDAIGNPIIATQQIVTVNVGAPLANDTNYFFRVTATDPSNNLPPIVAPTPLPPVFTGVQAISNLAASAVTSNGATVSWGSNIIGFGRVAFGAPTPNQTSQDMFNITAHAIDLAALTPATTYMFLASNIHSIDGDVLASANGQFTTDGTTTTVVFTQPHAEPRVISNGGVSTVSIRAFNQGNPVPGVVVNFSIDASSAGGGTLSTPQASTDSNGIASVQFTATSRGLVRVQVAASNATNSPKDIPVVVK
jgi:hypothetical protein